MSTLCPITGRQSGAARGLVDHLESCELAGSNHEVLHGLDTDVTVAQKRTRSFLGLLCRRGQVRFVILEEGSELAKDFKSCGYCISTITLGEVRPTQSDLRQAFAQIRQLRGTRINGLEELRVLHGSSAEQYFTFHVDLEAA